ARAQRSTDAHPLIVTAARATSTSHRSARRELDVDHAGLARGDGGRYLSPSLPCEDGDAGRTGRDRFEASLARSIRHTARAAAVAGTPLRVAARRLQIELEGNHRSGEHRSAPMRAHGESTGRRELQRERLGIAVDATRAEPVLDLWVERAHQD